MVTTMRVFISHYYYPLCVMFRPYRTIKRVRILDERECENNLRTVAYPGETAALPDISGKFKNAFNIQ